jgi:predicted AAA+ superfamily ATPase
MVCYCVQAASLKSDPARVLLRTTTQNRKHLIKEDVQGQVQSKVITDVCRRSNLLLVLRSRERTCVLQ